jgi:hypothetical protein
LQWRRKLVFGRPRLPSDCDSLSCEHAFQAKRA